MALRDCDFGQENDGATSYVLGFDESCPMNEPRFLEPAVVADQPLTQAFPVLPGVVCEMEWSEEWGSQPPIRLQPSQLFAGSSVESDRVLHRWRPRICDLVDQSILMGRSLCRIDWNMKDEPYPTCPFLKLLEPAPGSRDMRRFTDEACHILLQASSSDEIAESYWLDGRTPDARDVMEWLERWAIWLPDEEGQFRLWSAFMPCEALEALYRYVHSLVHDYYMEMMGLEMEWEEKRVLEVAAGEGMPDVHDGVPDQIIYWHPRLVLDGREYTLTPENAEELRDWSYDAFCSWKSRLTKDQKEALVSLGYEADMLCPEQRWPD